VKISHLLSGYASLVCDISLVASNVMPLLLGFDIRKYARSRRELVNGLISEVS
jgi:hypothetical protein